MNFRLPVSLLPALILAGIYYVSARLGLQLQFQDTQATPIWPPSGIALAALLLFGTRMAPGVFLGALLANLADFYVKSGRAEGGAIEFLRHFAGHPGQILVSAAIGFGNTMEAVAGTRLVRAFIGERSISTNSHSLLAFVLSSFFCCAIASSIGVASLSAGSFLPADLASAAWFTWWLGDATGILIVAPVVLVCLQFETKEIRDAPWGRIAISLLVVLVFSGFTFDAWFQPVLSALSTRAFGGWLDLASFSRAFILLSIVFWATFAYGEIVGKFAVAIVAATAVLGTIRGNGPFAGQAQTQSLLVLQVFLAAMSVSVLALDAALRERLDAARRTKEVLEERLELHTAALREIESRFRLLVESINEYAIFMLDPQGNVSQWNPGAQRLKGYAAPEIVGEHFSRFYTAEDRDKGLPNLALVTAIRSGKQESEGWRVRKDGSRFWANVIIEAIRDGNGRLVGFAKITRDMTVRRAMEEQLRQAQKMETLGQLTGGIAHDFNNLLTVIYGGLETLQRRIKTDAPDLLHLIEMSARATMRAATLTRQLLAFARRQTLEPEPIDLNRLVAGMSSLLRRTLGESIAIETILAGGLWWTSADVNQLESAVLNLAVNARDAMPDGGRLTIETANIFLDETYSAKHSEVTPGQYVMIAVSDTGAGMTPEVIAKAFEPFFTTKPEGAGTGLGLSQIYGFMKQTGGHVKIYSEPGEGTTVKLYLPRLSSGEIPETTDERPPLPAPGSGELILLVEDDEDVREHSAEILSELGYRVVTARTGGAALAIIDSEPTIRLLFTDVGLPGGINGRQLADEARKRRPDLKVLFTTGYARNAIVHQGRLDQDVQLIAKPFTYAALALKIRQVLDQ